MNEQAAARLLSCDTYLIGESRYSEHERFMYPPPSIGLHPVVFKKCLSLYHSGHYAEAAEKGFKIVRDRSRQLTGYETGSEAFGKGKLHVHGASAPHLDRDFNEAVKFLLMAIDNFRNDQSHTSDARITESARALHYLTLASLAIYLLDQAFIPEKSD